MKKICIYVIGVISLYCSFFVSTWSDETKLVENKKTSGKDTKKIFLEEYGKYGNKKQFDLRFLGQKEKGWTLGVPREKTELWIDENGTLYYLAKQLEHELPINVSEKQDGSIQIETGEKIFHYKKKQVKWKEEVSYLPLEEVAKDLGFEFAWDRLDNQVHLIGNVEGKLPKAYDLRKENRVTSVGDQGYNGSCWAFASLGALESGLLPKEYVEFSTEHMRYYNGFYDTEEGGAYPMAVAYLASWKGPVLERNIRNSSSGTLISASKHLEEAIFIQAKDYDSIKKAVFLYGGVETSIFTSLKSANSWSKYYNQTTNSYYFNEHFDANHDVVIVGWDDDFPKENFTIQPEKDGAFLCKNSWGESFGEDGYFYISYEDTVVGTNNVVYTKVAPVTNYDHIYQTDELGWVGQIGYGKEYAWFANVYEAKGKERLKAVSFYATMPKTSYEVYVVPQFQSEVSFANKRKVAEGFVKEAGYYTVNFSDSIKLKKGQKYGVVVYISSSNTTQPVAVEYEKDVHTSTFSTGEGEGYISLYGDDWTRIETKQNSNICLKAFTIDDKGR